MPFLVYEHLYEALSFFLYYSLFFLSFCRVRTRSYQRLVVVISNSEVQG